MKKRKFDKNLILTFLIGVLITIIIIKLVVPSIMEYKIETEFLDKVENAPIPLPYYSFASYHMKSFIALILPDKESYITENVVSNVRSKINEIYQPQFEVAINGISSDQETVDYMEKSGLLTELSLSGEEALNRLENIDTTIRAFEPKGDFAQYYPIDIPPNFVRYPAEYEEIGAVFVSWPVYHHINDWQVHQNFVREIVIEAQAWILVPNEYWQKLIELYLEENNVDLSSIKFFHVPTNDIWVRDFGPTTVLMGENSTPVFIWNPYVPLGLPGMLNDENVGAALAMYLNVPVYRLPVIVEGGNIITDGKGTIMMMESVLDNNAQVNREGLKEIMKSYLGAENLVTFPAVPGEACGHIDMIVKFIDEDTLIVAEVSNDHPWYNSLEDIAETLSDMTASNGEPYEIVRIMLPETVDDVQEWTYVNSLILNNKVIVPVYGTPEDEIALNVYQEIMPEYEIVSVDESNYAAGAIHCQAKEVPKSLVDQIS